MYKLLYNPLTQQTDRAIRLSDKANIPLYGDNTDYQEYLKWLEAGNTPLPAEEQGA
jgi:hypothetical protein